jgi:hypothetical protein
MGASNDTQAPAAGTFSLSGSFNYSCAVVSTAEFVYLSQTDTSPSMLIGRQ